MNKFYKMDIEEIKSSLGMEQGNYGENNTEDKINEGKNEQEPIHSEIYGVNKGHVYEKSTPTKITNNKVEPKKVESKKSSASTKVSVPAKKNIKGSNISNKANKGKTGKK